MRNSTKKKKKNWQFFDERRKNFQDSFYVKQSELVSYVWNLYEMIWLLNIEKKINWSELKGRELAFMFRDLWKEAFEPKKGTKWFSNQKKRKNWN